MNSTALYTYSSVLYNNETVPILVVASSADNIGELKFYNYSTNTWHDFAPKYLAAGGINANIVTRVRIVRKYSTRLILFNTSESDGAITRDYPNRIRYSEAGYAYNVDSWYQYPDTIEKGGHLDLPSGEIITAVEVLNGRLIVFCEKSIYQVVFSGNRFEPFGVTQIDGNIGSTSDSVVEIGGKLVFVNSFGLHYCDGVKAELLSNKINTFFSEKKYWFDYSSLFLNTENSLLFITVRTSATAFDGYTDTVLLYNYINDTYSVLYDNYTALGLSNVDRDGYKHPVQITMVGNNLGYMSQLSFTNNKSDTTMHVTSLIKPNAAHIDLKIYEQSFGEEIEYAIQITGSALADLNGSYIATYIDASTIRIINDNAIAGYVGDAYVSIIDKIDISTKEFSPYLKKGIGICINKIAFNVNKTDIYSVFAVNSAISANLFDEVLLKYIQISPDSLLENNLTRIWRTVNFQSSAETIALNIYFDEDMLLHHTTPFQEFSINAILLYVSPTKLI